MEKALAEKKEIFKKALKARYKQQYDAVQPIPYIRDKQYCVDNIFVEGGIKCYVGTDGFPRADDSWKVLKGYGDIFNPDLTSRRRILEGEPGYGKSTLTLQLAYDWSNSVQLSPLNDVGILILLRLRQLRGEMSVFQAIKLFLLPNVKEIKLKDIEDILTLETCLILLDGYDEYPGRDGDAESEIEQIISMKKLASFDVILTTRYLPKNYDSSLTKILQLTGFDDASREEYIIKAIAASERSTVEKIKKGLKDNPILDDICQVPLFFVMLAHLTHENETFQKFKSVTEVFGHLIECFHSHMRNKSVDENTKNYSTEFQKNHVELSKVAFDGLSKRASEIVWKKEYLIQRLGKKFYDYYVKVGILVEEEVFDVEGVNSEEPLERKIEVRFYHKLFCEWYASFVVSEVAEREGYDAVVKLLREMDPLDLQYVYRFACGLRPQAANNIIRYVRTRNGGEKFALLCFLEQSRKPEIIRTTIRDLCLDDVKIRESDTILLQRSTIELLKIGSSHQIPIQCLFFVESLASSDDGEILLKSGLRVPSIQTLKQIRILGGKKDSFTETKLLDVLNYGQRCQQLEKITFPNSVLPRSFTPGIFTSEMKSRNMKVLWASLGSRLDFTLSQWKTAEDSQTIADLCSDLVCIDKSHKYDLQKSTIDLLQKASTNHIPISCLLFVDSFRSAASGSIWLNDSDLQLNGLSSLKNLRITTERGRELTEDELVGVIEFGQTSSMLEEIRFHACLQPYCIPVRSKPFVGKDLNFKVIWFPYGVLKQKYQLDVSSGRWMDEDSKQELTEEKYAKEEREFHKVYRSMPWQMEKPRQSGAEQ